MSRLRTDLAPAAALLLLALVGGACSPAGDNVVEPETVVVISIDTTRRDHLSVYGYPLRTSPYLEVLAADAITFDAAVAVHTNTAPSHASILTGLYPPQHGSINNAVPILDGVPTLAEVLSDRGYDTAAFVSGKTLKAEHCGLDRGFSRYDDRFDGWERRAESTLNLARRWLDDRHPDRSLFLFFHLFDPHFLYSPPHRFAGFGLVGGSEPHEPTPADALRATTRRDTAEWTRDIDEWTRRYDAEIAYADWAVGQLLATLLELGRYTGATIVVVSDHGETLGERPQVFDHGGRVTEEQILVPLIVKLPDNELAGVRVPQQVSQIDIAPTILRTLGVHGLPGSPGVDLRDLPRGGTGQRRPLFTMARREPTRLGDLGFRVPPQGRWNGPESMIVAVRQPPFKLVDYGFRSGDGLRRLRDLEQDPAEVAFADDPGVASRYGELLDRWWSRSRAGELDPAFELDDQTTEMLEALGYVDSAPDESAIFDDGFETGGASGWSGPSGSGPPPR